MANLSKLADTPSRNGFRSFIIEEERKEAAWKKAIPIPGRPAELERWDRDYRIIRWSDYGLYTEYGWEIEHIIEESIGGSDDLCNLRARHWQGVHPVSAEMEPGPGHTLRKAG